MPFLEIAFGSVRELEYEIACAQRLGYMPDTNALPPKVIECSKVLGALVQSLVVATVLKGRTP